MCGIIGRIFREPARRDDLGGDAIAQLAHRGPDGSGVYTDDHVQFGHVRLSIIDLTDAGCQPMASADGRYIVTYNGEIYNYLELRAELEALGARFTSQSDTEVLLVAYSVWGSACVTRFRGMFAFALWDRHQKVAFLARDRCGEKPLFYAWDGDCLVFASELKALLGLLETRPELDVSIVDMFLHYQYVPEPLTLLKGVRKLPAAHTMLVACDSRGAEPVRYWNVETIARRGPAPRSDDEVFSVIRQSLRDAVGMTLRSDVPVGVALSGGIDSGAIAVLAQQQYPEPMHAFCVGYPGRPHYDERQKARGLADALGMVVHEVELPVQGFVDFFPQLVAIMDEPIADPAAFGHYSVPKAAADAGVKVLLSGIGGDEVFWGYPWVTQTAATNQLLHRQPLLREFAGWLRSSSAQSLLDRIARHPRIPGKVQRWAELILEMGSTESPVRQLRFYVGSVEFRDAFREKEGVYGPAMRALAPGNAFRPTDIGLRDYAQIPAAIIRLLFDTWLVSNCLTLGDRVSMAVGVETRLPFLDVDLIETVMALRAQRPDHLLGQKAWLRSALRGVLPDDVLARKKEGFHPPINEWLTGVINRYGDILVDGYLVRAGIISRDRVDFIRNQLPRRGWSGLFFAYKIVLLEMWHWKVVGR